MAIVRRFSVGKLPEDKVFKGQPKVIMDHLAKHPKSTVTEMAKAIGNFEGSRQTPERVIGFYMTTFKKQGLVKVEEVAEEDTKGAAGEADSGEEDEDDEELDEESAATGTGLPVEEQVQFHEELSAAEPSPGGRFDGLKMSEAVKRVLELKAQRAEDIAAYLTENGYTASRNQVSGALTNMVRQGVVKKVDQNTYGLR